MLSAERTQQIEQAIAEAEAQGLPWTNRLIYERIGGNYEQLAHHLKARRALAATTEEPTAVAALEPPAPASPQTPLARARWERDRTAQAEMALAEHEQYLKRTRQALDTRRQQLDIQAQTVSSDARDLERRRQLREVLTQLETREGQRRAVHLQRRTACAAMVEAHEAYEALQGQAARWLRRLRQAQRTAATSAVAFERGDAYEEFEQALGQLAALVGPTEAAWLADDPHAQPAWLRG